MKCLLCSLLMLSMIAIAAPVRAIVIDDFQISQVLNANVGTQDVNASIIGPGSQILGTERDLRINKIGTSISSVQSVFGQLQVSMGANSLGTVTLQWDGTADATKNNIDNSGLPFVDLTDGGPSDSITTFFANGLAPVTATVTIWAEGGSGTIATSRTLVIPASYTGDMYFLYDDFSLPVAFDQARAVQLELFVPQGGTIDLSILETYDLIKPSPEPSTGCLMLPLVLGLSRLRRRNGMAKRAQR